MTSVVISTAWRSPACLKARTNEQFDWDRSYIAPASRLDNCSALVSHDVHSFIAAISGGGPVSSHMISKGTVQLSRVYQRSTAGGDDKSGSYEFQVLSRIAHPSQLYDGSWCGNTMILASTDHVALYNIDPLTAAIKLPSASSRTPRKLAGGNIVSVELPHTKYMHDMTPTPVFAGTFQHRQAIISAKINKVDPSIFASIENCNLHIWDMNETTKPIYTANKASNLPNTVVEWNPHRQYDLMLGGYSDTRLMRAGSKPVVWKTSQVHLGGVLATKWSPFVPNWVASAGKDGDIRIWDLRTNRAPMMTLACHTDDVTALSWSFTHTDLLASGSVDGSVAIWSLVSEPSYCTARDTSTSLRRIVGLEYARKGVQFYSLNEEGMCTVYTASESALDSVVPRINDPSLSNDDHVKELMRELHKRNLNAAFSHAIELCTSYIDNNKSKEACLLLCSILPERGPGMGTAQNDGATLGTAQRDVIKKSFNDALYQYSVGLPPAYDMSKVTPDILEQLLVLKYDVRMSYALETGDVDRCCPVLLDDSLIEVIHKINMKTLTSIFKLVLAVAKTDVVHQVVDRAIKFATVLNAKGAYSDFHQISRLVLSPTIWTDPSPSEKARAESSIDSVIHNAAYSIEQMILKRDVNSILSSGKSKDDVASQVVMCVNEMAATVVSFDVLMAYLTSLLMQNDLPPLYTAAGESLTRVKGCGTEAVLRDLLINGANPLLFESFVALKDPSVLEASAANIERIIEIMCVLFNIASYADVLPIKDSTLVVEIQLLARAMSKVERSSMNESIFASFKQLPTQYPTLSLQQAHQTIFDTIREFL